MLNLYFSIFVFLFGTIIGSFITAFVPRFHNKKNWWSDRSECPNCHHKLGPLDLIPVFSYLFLRGKCRYCRTPYSSKYLLLELLSGACFLFLWLGGYSHLGNDDYLKSLPFLALALIFLLILSWYDYLYGEVIDQIAIPMVVILLIVNWQHPTTLILTAIIFLVFVLIVMFTNGMGGGDIRIAIVAALLTGWPNFTVAFEFAVVSALVCGVTTALIKHKDIKKIRKTAVPLIPFFTFGILMAWVFGDMIVQEFLKI